MGNKIFLTKDGIEKLQQEILYMKNVELKECIEAIAEARDKGDLSENAEYDAAKEKFDTLTDKLNEKTKLFTNAVVINEEAINTDSVQILTTVCLKDKKNNKELTYTIVPHIETNVKEGRISVNSPVAQSLIGKAKGESVKVSTPKGELELEILDIKI